jgi:hypothetical protein
LGTLEADDPIQNREHILKTKRELDELLYREEMMWLQRSHITWLKEGDRNTKIFHRKAIGRAKKNHIKKLKLQDNSWCTDQGAMQQEAANYFETLFSKDEAVDPQQIVDLFEECISPEMNSELCKEYTTEEISNALFQIGPLKAPGPDGYPARFFQRNWSLLKEDIVPAVQHFFATGQMPAGVNDTCIVLIPKGPDPETMKDFRPISLCNVIYKIVSKCMVNRLRPLLQDIISPNQSAFIPGRMITDNALIAFECLHAINTNSDSRSEYCAYKLDLSKAYDRVDWGFLNSVLLKLGFQSSWVHRVMACVSSVRYQIRFNGALTAPFTPSRGLRQGDPLSPYLFLFVADGLSKLINRKVQQNLLQELRICRGAPGVSHLLFADDTLLFFKVDVDQAMQVKDTIDTYERCTGQLINNSKCSIMFKGDEETATHAQVQHILGVGTRAFETKYLGLPTPSGRMKGEQFQSLKDRMSKRLNDFTEKHMSAAAKDVLIKAVAQALPTYIMGVFKIPLTLCDSLTSITRDFWWGSEHGKRRTAWVAWKELVLSKGMGGLGFRDLRIFNQALLARQAWRILDKPGSLCARLLKAKYFPRGSLIDTVTPANASPTWNAILHCLDLLKQGLIWRIGNGASVRIRRDPWIPRGFNCRATTRRGRCRLHWVSDLLDSDRRGWNYGKITTFFYPADAEAIAQIKLPERRMEDVLAWFHEKSGIFTVRSAYRLGLSLQESPRATATSSTPDGERKLWSRVWNAAVPPKVRIFAWKLARDILPTQKNKFIRKLEMDSQCPLCNCAVEDSYHATVECPQARNLRCAMREHWPIPDEKLFRKTGPDWLSLMLDKCTQEQGDLIILILWRAWSLHNNATHNSGSTSISESVFFLLNYRDTLLQVSQHESLDEKGKAKCWVAKPRLSSMLAIKQSWEVPPAGWIKVNVDASFVNATGEASVGVVIRNHKGEVLLTAWRVLLRCASAEACVDGLRLASKWCAGPTILESDSARLVAALGDGREDRSELRWTILEAKEYLQLLPE